MSLSVEDKARKLDEVAELMRKMRLRCIENDGLGSDDDVMKQDTILKDWYMDKKRPHSGMMTEPKDLLQTYRSKSLMRRKHVLNAANNKRFEAECMGELRTLESEFRELQSDIEKYPFAWFGIIFADREHLDYSHLVVKVLLAYVKLQLEMGNPQISTIKMCELAVETFSEFSQKVAKEMWETKEREKWAEYANDQMLTTYDFKMLKWQYYGLLGKKEKAVTAFEEALLEEMFIEGEEAPPFVERDEDGYLVELRCRDLVLTETGKKWSLMREDLSEDDYWACVKKGIQILKESGKLAQSSEPARKVCSTCKKSKSEVGTTLLTCSRCGWVYYCSKTCQTNDWKRHKKECAMKKTMKLLRKRL